MKIIFSSIVIFYLLLLSDVGMVFAASGQKVLNSRDIVQNVISKIVIPDFKIFARQTAKLKEDTKELCTISYSQNKFKALQHEFKATVAIWSKVEILRTGPLLVNNRVERILFWPDVRGIGVKQINKIIKGRDSSYFDNQALIRSSIAVQGLGALEIIFFNHSAAFSNDDRFICDYAVAIADNLATMADVMVQEWQSKQQKTGQSNEHNKDSFPNIWLNPGKDNHLFRDDKEQLASVVKLITQGLKLVTSQRIAPVIKNNKLRPGNQVFRRSGQFAASLRNNIITIDDLLGKSGLFSKLKGKNLWLKDSIGFEIANALRALNKLEARKATDAKSEEDQVKDKKLLQYINAVLQGLYNTIDHDLATALGISTGFNALDGD